MNEEDIADVGKGLLNLMVKIKEIVPQCHPEVQTYRHKILYFSHAIAEFSEWSFDPMKNINAKRYTFNRFVTEIHYSVQAEIKVSIMYGQLNASAHSYSVPLSTHIQQYPLNHLQVRNDCQRPKTGNARSFDKALRLGAFVKCFEK